MAVDNSNSTMEMGTSDQVLVATKRKKNIAYIVSGVAMLVAVGVVIALVVVLSGNEGTPTPEEQINTTEGPTSPVDPTTSSTTTTPAPTEPTTDPPTDPTTEPPPEPTDPPTVPPTEPPEPPIELEEIINGVFGSASFSGAWTGGSEVMFRNPNGDLVLYDIDTDTTTQLIPNTSQTLQLSGRPPLLSPDQSHVVLAYQVEPVFRHSFLARYAAVSLVDGSEVAIVAPSSSVSQSRATEGFLQNFIWGPEGTSLAFVYGNNIYYQENLSSAPVQITTSGVDNVIYNGIPDWVYEEEVLGSNNAMWFSADGLKLAFATFNDTEVRIMKVPHYGVPGLVDWQYTRHDEIRYPKSGTTNPTVSVTIKDLDSGNQTVYSAPSGLTEPILRQVRFVSNETIALMWTNRVQNILSVVLCTFDNTICTQIYSYTEADGWIDNIPLHFNAEGNSFITILPQSVNGVLYKQIVQVSEGEANLWTAQNRINIAHTVLDILLWTPDDVIWYKATHVNDSAEQHIYTTNEINSVSCFTCGIRREDGGECLYNEAVISEGASRVALTCAGPDVPKVYIYSAEGTYVRTWDDNNETVAALVDRQIPEIIRLQVPVADGLPDADVHIQVPSNYLERTNVPLLVYVYGGPESSLVTKQWGIDWGTSLVSRWNIAVAHIDGRGSGLRGVANTFTLNRALGTYEIDDQINVTKYLQDNLSWLDSNRTCIWGWSYGGYAASLALARGGSVFRCAAAVAPVVDWRFYDTIYTERYMDLPEANAEAYAKSSLLTEEVVEAYRDKRYFLVHGTADDNVHYQHAMLISRLLQRQDVYFTQMSYTDEDHGLVGVRPHLYHALEKFFKENML